VKVCEELFLACKTSSSTSNISISTLRYEKRVETNRRNNERHPGIDLLAPLQSRLQLVFVGDAP